METWIPSELNRISPLVDQIMRLIQLTGFVSGKEADIEIALCEALNNAVQHGNRSDPEKRVYVTCRFDFGEGVTLIVRDEGQGFDPNMIPDALAAEALLSEHGRGLFLMRFFMDEVSFKKGGTEVHMRKSVTREPERAPQSDRSGLRGSATVRGNQSDIAMLPATHVRQEVKTC